MTFPHHPSWDYTDPSPRIAIVLPQGTDEDDAADLLQRFAGSLPDVTLTRLTVSRPTVVPEPGSQFSGASLTSGAAATADGETFLPADYRTVIDDLPKPCLFWAVECEHGTVRAASMYVAGDMQSKIEAFDDLVGQFSSAHIYPTLVPPVTEHCDVCAKEAR